MTWTTAYALPRECNDEVRMSATAAGHGGDVVQLPDGRYGIVKRLKPYAIGDEIAVAVEPGEQFDFVKKSGDTFSAGDSLYWDATNGYVTSTSGSNVELAKAVYAAGATAQRVRGYLLTQTETLQAST